MTGPSTRHDPEVQLVARALRVPLPPARPAVDPAALWACGRQARRISTEAKISLVVTAAQVGAFAVVLGVLVSFVDWRGVWAATTSALVEPRAGSYAALAAVATGAAAVAAQLLHRKA